MVLTSAIFLFALFPASFVLDRLVSSTRGKNALLLVLSMAFYSFGRLTYVPLLAGSILINWAAGRLLGSWEGKAKRRAVGCAAVAFDIGLMAVFKYLDFIITNINALLGVSIPLAGIPMPLGISFFTFTSISYVVEVWRRPANMAKSLWEVALYISFFPAIASGPIMSWKSAAPQLRERVSTTQNTARGIRRFILGLAKKLLIADIVGRAVDGIYSGTVMDARLAWLAGIGYAVQIYFDFSGYTDMAIGVGTCFGITLPENFDRPYTSLSLTDFWKRWHMSLTTWFRNYLYMPLVMSRPLQRLYKRWSAKYGRAKANRLSILIPMAVVWLLTGLWHGAAWHFVVWGLWHGLFCALEGVGIIRTKGLARSAPGRLVLRVYTMLVVVLGTVLFRAESLAQAGQVMAAMFTGWQFTAAGTLTLQRLINGLTGSCLLFGAVVSVISLPKVKKMPSRLEKVAEPASYVVSLALLVLCIMAIAQSGFQPFIYQQF